MRTVPPSFTALPSSQNEKRPWGGGGKKGKEGGKKKKKKKGKLSHQAAAGFARKKKDEAERGERRKIAHSPKKPGTVRISQKRGGGGRGKRKRKKKEGKARDLLQSSWLLGAAKGKGKGRKRRPYSLGFFGILVVQGLNQEGGRGEKEKKKKEKKKKDLAVPHERN